jgi:hypothetical protein
MGNDVGICLAIGDENGASLTIMELVYTVYRVFFRGWSTLGGVGFVKTFEPALGRSLTHFIRNEA